MDEELPATILESLDLGAVVLDAEGGPVWHNAEAERLLGRAASLRLDDWPEACGFFLLDHVSPIAARDLPPARALVGERVAGEEIYLRGADGRDVRVRVRAAPRRAADGSIRGAVALFEWNAGGAGGFAEEIVDHVPHPVFVKDRGFRFVLVNQALCELVGYPAEVLLGKTDYDFFPREQADFFRQKDAEMFQRESCVAVEEEPITDAHGALHVLATTKAPLRTPSGRVAYLVGIIHDITALKATERALRESESRARALAEASPVGIFRTDAAGHSIYANERLGQIMGLSPDEIRGTDWLRAVHPDDRERVAAGWTASVEAPATSSRPHALEYRCRHEDGTITSVLAQWSPIRVGGELTGFIGTITDVTQQKQTEDELRTARDAAERLNRELEAFSYSVSHDLRAPLRAIDGFSQAILEDCADRLDDHGRDHLRRVRENAQRMGRLIDDMLRLSRVGRSEMRREEVDLGAIARQIADELRHLSPDRQVELCVADGLVTQGDPRLLRVAVQNLLDNAWKFTGGRASARIEVGSFTLQGERVFFVRDDGAGFDTAYAGKLFQPFSRLHAMKEFPGTGIGLATVQRIIHRHGGRVWAEGAVGCGACFYFTMGPAALD